MSLSGDLIFGRLVAYDDFREIIKNYSATEYTPEFGGVWRFAIQCGDGDVIFEAFQNYEVEIYEKSDEDEFMEIKEKIGGDPKMSISLDISRLANPKIYLKLFAEICTQWAGVYDNHDGKILRFDGIIAPVIA